VVGIQQDKTATGQPFCGYGVPLPATKATEYARPANHPHPPRRPAQTRLGRAVQRLRRVLPGRTVPAGGAVVTPPPRCLRRPALERRTPTLPVRCAGGAVAGPAGTALDCRWPGLRCHLERGTFSYPLNPSAAFKQRLRAQRHTANTCQRARARLQSPVWQKSVCQSTFPNV
jgi:hypothetical protein